jgi:hypothetical protein
MRLHPRLRIALPGSEEKLPAAHQVGAPARQWLAVETCLGLDARAADGDILRDIPVVVTVVIVIIVVVVVVVVEVIVVVVVVLI